MWNGRVDVSCIQPSTVSFGAVHIVDVLLCDSCACSVLTIALLLFAHLFAVK
jgi:hypothetical protein